jgi:cobalt/nickel transport system ATP-binding protein
VEAVDLGFGFDARQDVLRGITFSIPEGQRVGFAGANGAGKTTLLWCLLGLRRATGTIRLFGEPPARRLFQRVGFVFQNPEDQLFMPTIHEDVALPLVHRGMSRDRALELALARLDSVGLRDVASRPASELSLGERKRACLAAALAQEPELLLLDEPTAELDAPSVRRLAGTLAGLRVSCLIASHHLEFLREVTERILLLAGGRILADGPTADLLGDRALLEQAGLI